MLKNIMNTTQKQNSSFTPMMRQYLEIKKDYKDTILFFRLGDFYEMFFEDAKEASALLGLTLTSREAGKNNRVPMCGIPYHAAENYIARLIRHSRKVAICEQVEDHKASNGIVRRDIIRVITPGTLVAENILSAPGNNYLAAVYQQPGKNFGLAVADLSTGEFNVTELETQPQLLSELTRLKPAELLFNSHLKENNHFMEKVKLYSNAVISGVDEWIFDFSAAYEKLTSHFNIQNLRGFGCEEMFCAVPAAGAVLHYLEETQKTRPLHVQKISPYSLNKFMMLDGIAQRNLELIHSMGGNKKTSLLEVLDFTDTAMGRRLIVQWIQKPLLEITRINARLNAVEELFNNRLLINGLTETLKQINDIERLISRVSLGAANARDLYSLAQSLKIMPRLKIHLKDMKSEELVFVRDNIEECDDLIKLIDESMREDAPVSVREGGMIRRGFNKELDELLDITSGGKNWMASLQREEIKRTGISSLKVKYNRVFGYYIEITNANLRSVPLDYIRKQTLVNAERFITPALKEQEEKIFSAEEKVVEMEYKLFQEICRKVLDNIEAIQKNALLIAKLDVLNSFAAVALGNNYTKPQMSEDNEIKITGGRHPVLENILPSGKFIPNDTTLDTNEDQILIITGPNMAGKSTYIRSVALIVLMAQMGCFVPASSAKIGITDKIFTRVGASDDISLGMSTFMMEMTETANILNNATGRSLVILDEIGRGTSTFDGLSIAWAVVEYLHEGKSGRPRTLFATHYHELAELENALKGVKNYNVAIREWNDEVTFLYKLKKGSADHSYGIHVGRLAGLPQEVVKRAGEILNTLEISRISEEDMLKDKEKKARQLEMFSREKSHPVLDEIKEMDIDNTTPITAFELINKWKEKLRNGK
ncbi:MAG: DNA mismatch repair protein MutS [Candidatus Omnitrophota bacterium]